MDRDPAPYLTTPADTAPPVPGFDLADPEAGGPTTSEALILSVSLPGRDIRAIYEHDRRYDRIAELEHALAEACAYIGPLAEPNPTNPYTYANTKTAAFVLDRLRAALGRGGGGG